MKTRYWIGLLMAVLGICGIAVVANASDFYAPLEGSLVVPPSGSSGTGYAHFSVKATFDSVAYMISYSGLGSNATSLDIHIGVPFTNGPVGLHIGTGGGTSNSLTGTLAWPAVLRPYAETHTCQDGTYLEVDTESDPAGELRGPLLTPA